MATTDLFAEMDEIADELRENPQHVDGDLQIAFWQVQRLRRPDLSKQEWLDLFDVWRLHNRARQEARRADVPKLLAERDKLFAVRATLPPEVRSRIDARLREIGRAVMHI